MKLILVDQVSCNLRYFIFFSMHFIHYNWTYHFIMTTRPPLGFILLCLKFVKQPEFSIYYFTVYDWNSLGSSAIHSNRHFVYPVWIDPTSLLLNNHLCNESYEGICSLLVLWRQFRVSGLYIMGKTHHFTPSTYVFISTINFNVWQYA